MTTFRGQIFIGFSTLSLTIILVVSLLGYREVERRLMLDATIQLTNETRLVAERIRLQPNEKELQGTVTTLGNLVSARITIISPEGFVLADSAVTSDRLPSIENHRTRPEVADALLHGKGDAIRFSDTVRQRMLYVAIRSDEPPLRIVRLALPLTTIDSLRRGAISALLPLLLLLLGGALALSAIFARLVSHPLSRMAEAADRLGGEEWTLEIPLTGCDEVAQLGRTLNRMGRRIQEQITSLAETTREMETIVQTMGEGLLLLDRWGSVLLANDSFRRHFGITADPRGKRLFELCRNPDLLDLWHLHIQNPTEQTAEVHLPSGTTLHTHLVPLPDREGAVAVFLDITERKRLEQVRKDFVANVSHELKTPVSVIKGYAETLLSEGMVTRDPESAKRFIATIHEHAERLASLIRDILTLSRMESSRETIPLSPLDIAEPIAAAVGIVTPRAREKSLSIDTSRVVSARVAGHRQHLEQAILNLLDNAVTYTPVGGKITVSVTTGANGCQVSVTDTGIGIPSEHLPRIFERFYRVDPSRSREEGGTGLGLAIVKHIVTLHGGSVTVESSPGSGSRFTILLPPPQS
ncbi:MAG: phosphate regulon sensor histidine kinase PhoR [Desulfuromonadia bacterium]